MHDLNVINRLNAEATAAEIPQLRASGLWVVALYSGLSYISHTSHASAAEAQARVDAITLSANPGERSQLLEPIVQAEPDAEDGASSGGSSVPVPGSAEGQANVNQEAGETRDTQAAASDAAASTDVVDQPATAEIGDSQSAL